MAAVISAVPQIPVIAPSRMRHMNYRRRGPAGRPAEYGPDHPSGALDRAHRVAVQMIDDHARPSPRFHFALAATEQVAAGSARSGCAARAAANIARRTLTRPGLVAKNDRSSAYYVAWHRRMPAPLLFEDHDRPPQFRDAWPPHKPPEAKTLPQAAAHSNRGPGPVPTGDSRARRQFVPLHHRNVTPHTALLVGSGPSPPTCDEICCA
jgi:hypothetical protein